MKKKSSYINFPQVIQSLIVRVENFVHDHCRYGRSGIYKAMRPERSNSLIILLTALSKKAVLGLDGIFCKVIDGVCYPLVVEDMARLSGLSVRNVERCLHDLTDMKYLESSRQVKRTGQDGNLEVGPVLRRFTEKFWVAIGLWGQFVSSVKYAASHCRLRISWKFHKVVDKAKKIVAAITGSDAAKVPKDDRERARQRSNKIFFAYLDCSKKHGPGCLGGYANDETCAFCRKMRSAKA